MTESDLVCQLNDTCEQSELPHRKFDFKCFDPSNQQKKRTP